MAPKRNQRTKSRSGAATWAAFLASVLLVATFAVPVAAVEEADGRFARSSTPGLSAVLDAAVVAPDAPSSVEVIGGKVTVEILHSMPDAHMEAELTALGATPLGSVPGWLMLARVHLDALTDVAAIEGVDFVREPLMVSLPEPSRAFQSDAGFSALVVGEEVAKTRADDWHSAGHDGSGVRVGIVDGFDRDIWMQAESAGEVPVPAGTFCRDEGVTCVTPTPGSGAEHGTAVAEVIHEMAPGAELWIAQVETASDLQAAVDWFAANGVSIISRSLAAQLDGPGDGTGAIDAVADSAVSQGMAFFNAAGNHAGTIYKGSYWRGTWTDADLDNRLDFAPGVNSLEMACHAAVGGYPFIQGLRWSDWQASGRTDYDLLVYEDSALTILKAGGIEDQTTGAPPLEHLNRITDDFGPCQPNDYDYVVVELYADGSGTTGDTIEIMANMTWFDHYQNPYSASQPISDSRTRGVISVGAVDPPLGTAIGDYSSQGPTNDGRTKPDLVAAAGVASFTYGLFEGTSASTPAAAGAAALVVGAGLASSPGQLHDWLVDHAVVDRGSGGPDSVFGYGELILPAPPSSSRNIVITNPAHDDTVEGTVVVTADTSGSVTGVDFLVDGASIGTDTTPGNGWSASWTTTHHVNGRAEITARVTDDLSVHDTVSVVVDNPVVPPGDAVQVTNLPAFADVEAMGTNGPGTHLVYLADATTDDVLELFSVPVAGPPSAAVRLSPALNSGESVGAFGLLPSGDVVFEVLRPAQFGSYDALGVWVVDSEGGTPRRLTGEPLSEGIVFWSVSANGRLIYNGDLDAAGTVELYSVPLSGTAGDEVKLSSVGAGGYVELFRPSPDASRVVFTAAASASSPVELFSVPVDGPAGAAVPLNHALSTNEVVGNFFVAPDGSRVVYEAWDMTLPSEAHFDLFSVSVAGPRSQATAITDTRSGGGSVSWFDWAIAADSARVVYIYEDPAQFQLTRLFSVGIDGPPSAAIELHQPQAAAWGPRGLMMPGDGILFGDISLTGHGDVVPVDRAEIELNVMPGDESDRGFSALAASSERVAYVFDEGFGTDDVLWTAPAAGPASAGVDLNQGDVYRNGMRVRYSADGDYVVYISDKTAADVFELYAVPSSGPAWSTVRLNGPLPSNGDVWTMRVTPDGRHVVFHADQDADNVFELYQVPIAGPATAGVKLNDPLPPGEIVQWFFIARDGSRVFYVADHVYAVPLAAGPALPLCDGIEASLVGTDGPDTLRGTEGPDVIAGLGGDDVISGLGGDDLICGDAGNDTLLGGLGDDTLFGGPGDDLIRGHAGDDTAYGGDGEDRIQDGPGADALYGGADKDKLWGGIGADKLWGDEGRDQLYGGRDDDWLDGGIDTDRIWGDSGDDVLRGDANSDYLYGGIGRDVMYGGDGNDRMYGWNDPDELYGQSGKDQLRGQGGDDIVNGGQHYDWCSVETVWLNCEQAI